jgi:hypothetical protein
LKKERSLKVLYICHVYLIGSPKKDDEADGPILDQKKVLQVKEPEVCKYNSQSTPLKHTQFFWQAA